MSSKQAAHTDVWIKAQTSHQHLLQVLSQRNLRVKEVLGEVSYYKRHWGNKKISYQRKSVHEKQTFCEKTWYFLYSEPLFKRYSIQAVRRTDARFASRQFPILIVFANLLLFLLMASSSSSYTGHHNRWHRNTILSPFSDYINAKIVTVDTRPFFRFYHGESWGVSSHETDKSFSVRGYNSWVCRIPCESISQIRHLLWM